MLKFESTFLVDFLGVGILRVVTNLNKTKSGSLEDVYQ